MSNTLVPATNAAGTSVLDIRRGTNVLSAGLIDVDQLVVTNALGKFEFNGGLLVTRGAVISNGSTFVVGTSGTTPGCSTYGPAGCSAPC